MVIGISELEEVQSLFRAGFFGCKLRSRQLGEWVFLEAGLLRLWVDGVALDAGR